MKPNYKIETSFTEVKIMNDKTHLLRFYINEACKIPDSIDSLVSINAYAESKEGSVLLTNIAKNQHLKILYKNTAPQICLTPKQSVDAIRQLCSSELADQLDWFYTNRYITYIMSYSMMQNVKYYFVFNIYGDLAIKRELVMKATTDIALLAARSGDDTFTAEKCIIDSIDYSLTYYPNRDKKVSDFINTYFSDAGKLYYVTCGGVL